MCADGVSTTKAWSIGLDYGDEFAVRPEVENEASVSAFPDPSLRSQLVESKNVKMD